HHFPNKQVLISAVFDDELKRFDLSIENFLSHESESYGCFTRAYIRSIFIFCTEEASALTFSLCAEPELMTRWDNWLAQRLERHCSTDCSPTLSVARLAADGFWFNYLLKGEKIDISADIKNIQQKLISMTINSDGLVG
ncbi:TPA: TetR/AcrR family transcriptional regulator, partial [Klebsiella pneumoniae]|nr:TetR/AcrR family transcriptional regulator [Klebsiella pneumoniae]HCT6445829.1 TetR/AcrR family transcriptional regulator [Enterobacter hormaechei]HDG7659005.1 TetR/AcrR family transcriptional regulator [Klebsiella pneumoniae]